jgi:FtsZ-interacting cell division protein ZipA
MTLTTLLGVCITLVVAMIGLLVKIVWDVKREAREAKMCVASKKDKADCNREMDKLEERLK